MLLTPMMKWTFHFYLQKERTIETVEFFLLLQKYIFVVQLNITNLFSFITKNSSILVLIS